MANAKHEIVEVASGGSLNQAALELCEIGKRTIIITKKDGFVPPVHRIIALRGFVSFNESECYFSTVTENFDKFERFILVGDNINHFEQEFFRQLRKNTGKEIVEIYHKAKDRT